MKTQIVGDLRIDRVVESEGPFVPYALLLPAATQELIDANADWLKPRFVDPTDDRVIMGFCSFILRTPRHAILVDACSGNDKERPLRPNWHRQKHRFLESMAQAGTRPEEIDFVFCTHLHADHVGWNTRLVDGRWVPTFPNARYLFARREYEHWEQAQRKAASLGADMPNHGSFADSVLPVMEAGRAVLVESDHEIETGVHLEPAYGHTPGSCLLHARNRGAHALFLGDVMHSAIQLANPALSSQFCADPVTAAKVRTSLCERYADTDTTILTGHFPTPNAGRILRHRNAFRFAFSNERL